MTTNVTVSTNYVMAGKSLRVAVIDPITQEVYRDLRVDQRKVAENGGTYECETLYVHDSARLVIEEIEGEIMRAEPVPEPQVDPAPVTDDTSTSDGVAEAVASMVSEGSPVDLAVVRTTTEEGGRVDVASTHPEEVPASEWKPEPRDVYQSPKIIGADTGETVEQEIQRKGLTAPRVTPADIEAAILAEQYWNPTGTTLTICALTLQNGTTVVGESACASPENFDAALGQRIARDDAKRKVWALEGYLLRERLSHGLSKAA